MKEKLKRRCTRILLFLVAIMSSFSVTYAQSGAISGIIKDSSGEAVIGASVVVKGTTKGMMTGMDGTFTLDAPAGSTLVVSFLGYKTQEITVGNQKTLNIILKDDTELLKEVVVIGYGSVKKDDATGSVIAIKAEEMNKGLTTSATDMLAGKVPGVNINTAGGEPGAGAAIRIRGGSSLSATNDPLIVIDGIPMNSNGPGGLSNALSAINPTDIESFTVLKDASATAIYGSRASNGVVIVTTKKGRLNQKLSISYNGNFSVSKNDKTIDVLSADEYRKFIDDRFSTDADYQKIKATLGTANTDWQDEIFRIGTGTDHNLSFLGSIAKLLPFRVSAGYTNQNGTLLNSKFERFTGSLSLTPSFFNKHLNVTVNAQGSYFEVDRADAGAVGAAASFDPTQPVMNGSDYLGYFAWLGEDGFPLSIATKNPLALLETKTDLSYGRTFVGNALFDYKLHFFPDLKFSLNLGLDYSDSNGNKITDPRSALEFTNKGSFEHWKTKNTNELLDFYGQYIKEVTSIESKFDVMGGYSWQHFKRGNNYKLAYDGRPVEDPDRRYYEGNSPLFENYLISFFGRFNYTLKDRYLLTFTLRHDGTSRFSKENRWATFPSAALGWKMKEESFLKDVSLISDMKLRLGWGITGQQNLSNDKYMYPSMPIYTLSKDQAYYLMGNDANGNPIWSKLIRPSSYNDQLKWEETTTYNVGLDYGFLNNRINGAIDFYVRDTKDLLNLEFKTPAGANVGEFIPANIGDMRNTGLEFSINAKPVVTDGFRWEIGYNIAYNKTEITKIAASDASKGRPVGWVGGDGGNYSQMHSKGQAPFAFYLYEQIYDKNGKPIEGMYVDQDKDGEITENDKVFFKKPAADVTMGFNSKFYYKNFDFGFNGRASIGNYVYNGVAATHTNIGKGGIYANAITSNVYKSALDTDYKSLQLFSTHNVRNASFVKLDNITLGYSFNKIFGLKIGGRVYGTMQNIFTITPYDGLDPEVDGTDIGQSGIDNKLYPRPKTFIFGVNLNL